MLAERLTSQRLIKGQEGLKYMNRISTGAFKNSSVLWKAMCMSSIVFVSTKGWRHGRLCVSRNEGYNKVTYKLPAGI